MAGIDNYRTTLRSAVRGYWSGAMDLDQFFETVRTAMNRRLTQAFEEGAAECGIKPDEFTPDEQLALGNAIADELSHVQSLAVAINQSSKLNKGKLTPLLGRVENWVSRYTDLKNLGKIMACKDQKLVWIYGDTEHCDTCAKLHGKVKRASQWRASGIRPQHPPNPMLECQGWRCQCVLMSTDEPISKGPLPRYRAVPSLV